MPIQTTKVNISKAEALKLVRRWECFGYSFPRTQEGIEALRDAFMDITGTIEEAVWLSQQVVNGFPRCPAPIELRRFYTAKRGPAADGIHERDLDASDYLTGGKGRAE